jgi:hypothetical protein
MGLFGRKKTSELETAADAAAMLAEALSGAGADAKASLKALEGLGRDHHRWFGLEGELHREFADEVLKAWRATDPSRCPDSFPSLTLVDWERWDAPTMRDLWETAGTAPGEVLFIGTSGRRATRNALKELEALRLLAGSPLMGMTVYCQENVFLRKQFLLGTRGVLPPDSEDILQDLLDYSTTRGIPAGDIW